MPEIRTIPTTAPTISPERLPPERVCPTQKERVTRRIETDI